MATPVFPPIGMSPSVWGPIFWTTMHIVTLGYSHTPSEQEKEGVRQFFESLTIVIPCPICREHYGTFLKASPPATESRDTLIFWLFTLHNRVNEKLGKPAISFEQFIANMVALSKESHVKLPCTTQPSQAAAYLLLGGVLGFAGYILYQKYK